ncbi:MAG: SDR family NAD(P)-dependent oxidoreductase [Parasphingorhabdus sp.]|nr:SDR family NAD(P)-dependent oxidoreductase [Parasphingorhabdus sp.]
MTERKLAVVVGANGGLGQALASKLARNHDVMTFARSFPGTQFIDLELEESIVAAAHVIAATDRSPAIVIAASGLLSAAGNGPEKALRDLSGDWAMKNFQVNAIGPALVAKHFVPLMPRREPAIFAAISARVGSISDNRLGGWHSYRASKAALNMFIRNIAIEWSRKNPESIAVALHPGTVDTALSKPFQGNVPAEKLFDAEFSAAKMLDVLAGLSPEHSGRIFAWDGNEIAP